MIDSLEASRSLSGIQQSRPRAADRLLTGAPARSTGKLSVVQLAVEAEVKYWVVAQKHTDLRDHFQRLAAEIKKGPSTAPDINNDHDKLAREYATLRAHCTELEQLVNVYATVINDLVLENQALRHQAAQHGGSVTPLDARRHLHHQQLLT